MNGAQKAEARWLLGAIERVRGALAKSWNDPIARLIHRQRLKWLRAMLNRSVSPRN